MLEVDEKVEEDIKRETGVGVNRGGGQGIARDGERSHSGLLSQ